MIILTLNTIQIKFDLLLKSTMTPIQSRKMTTPMKITTIRSGRRPSKHPSHLNNNVMPSQYYFTILLNILFRPSQTKVVQSKCWLLLILIPWVFGQKRSHLIPLGYPGLLDHGVLCHGQHLRPYEVIDEVTGQGTLFPTLTISFRNGQSSSRYQF